MDLNSFIIAQVKALGSITVRWLGPSENFAALIVVVQIFGDTTLGLL
ncbi:MAG: hypothetical protein ACQERF_00890 [Actinomycetota bacterium]